MRKRRWLWLLVAVVALGGASSWLWCSWRAVETALEAEKTLGAYCLVMDILTVYVRQHSGEWPRGWDDLIATIPEQEYGGWSWPEDIRRIRDRVDIDFSVRGEDVVSQSPEHFSAVKQIGPNYGSREGNINALLQAIREAAERGKPRHHE